MRLIQTLALLGAGLALAGVASTDAAQAADKPCNLKAANAKAAGAGCARAWMDANLRLNDLMTVGTHNSYKQAISPKIFAMIMAAAPKAAPGLDYHHPTLDAQLDDGARGLELDVAYDPKGGLFAHPVGPKLAGESVSDAYVAAMSKPGFKVMHVQDIDFRSSCLTFVECLTVIRDWSDAHPDHTPILITINAKDDASPAPGGTPALKYDTAAYDALDAEIASVMTPGKYLITPDMIQGKWPTLREAVVHGAWPTLGESRGKFLIALDEDPPKVAVYRGPRRSLEGRMMFIYTDEHNPASAYITLNEASDAPRITAAAKAGFLVRTRADADTVEARSNDTKRRTIALASGAQYVSTDYRHPETRFSDYQVRLPDGAITVCNPQRAPERCAGLTVEPDPDGH
jgi:hypothetical protein